MKKPMFATLLVAALAACAGCALAQENVKLEGVLTLKGSDPRPMAVLVRPKGHEPLAWELEGLPASAGQLLQNRLVTVSGVVTRKGEGFRLPAVQVTEIVPAP